LNIWLYFNLLDFGTAQSLDAAAAVEGIALDGSLKDACLALVRLVEDILVLLAEKLELLVGKLDILVLLVGNFDILDARLDDKLVDERLLVAG